MTRRDSKTKTFFKRGANFIAALSKFHELLGENGEKTQKGLFKSLHTHEQVVLLKADLRISCGVSRCPFPPLPFCNRRFDLLRLSLRSRAEWPIVPQSNRVAPSARSGPSVPAERPCRWRRFHLSHHHRFSTVFFSSLSLFCLLPHSSVFQPSILPVSADLDWNPFDKRPRTTERSSRQGRRIWRNLKDRKSCASMQGVAQSHLWIHLFGFRFASD